VRETQSRSETKQIPNELTSHARIIVVSQFFGPDQSSVGQFLADFANGAAAAGHDVRVICGASDYDPAESSPPAPPGRQISEVSPPCSSGCGTIRVVRVRTATFSQSKAKKLLSYATFYLGALWRALWIPKPDVVLTLTAPPGLAWIGWLIQRIRGCRHVAWEMDVYPDVAIALDIPVAAWTSRMLDFPRRRANAIIALGPCMRTRLLQHGIAGERIIVAENWADGHAIIPLPFPEPRPLRVLYSGNFGLAHDVATIRAVMDHMANSRDLLFTFAGGGLARRELVGFCRERGIENVHFAGYSALQELGANLAECHVGLVTQKYSTIGAVVPSKIYGLMAAGRPALFIGPAAATPALLIERFDCGWQFECGDESGVLSLLTHLLEHPEEIQEKGHNGRKAFLDSYDKPAGVKRVMLALGLETRNAC